jgi:MtN3 and saliva related transmembrane protein
MVLEIYATILALIATIVGSISTIGYFTQIFKIVKRKSSADVSILTYMLFLTAAFVWLLYGLTINSLPLLITNAIVIIGAFSVIVTSMYYKK